MTDILFCPLCGRLMRDIARQFDFQVCRYESHWCDVCETLMKPGQQCLLLCEKGMKPKED